MFEEEKITEKSPIYGKWMILSFCVFFSPAFGGVLLFQNLKDIGQKKVGTLVLLVSMLFAVLTSLLAATPYKGYGTDFISKLIFGAILVEFVFGRYFLDEDSYPKKSASKPLIIGFALILGLVMIATYYGIPLVPQ
ncbi:MAG: hypothetical protein CFE21_04695 [Bacteroidetes bacterium B1(2017)]|nr:MAG: hypothetical protein CFE21_04695 [Bacteroidetes bacterium B1(2017)]